MPSLRRSLRLSGATLAEKEHPAQPALLKRKRKTSAATTTTVEPGRPETTPPETPAKRRGRPRKDAPPVSPVIAAVAAPSTPIRKPRHVAVSRLANPEATNATLLSPETSRVIVVPLKEEAQTAGDSPGRLVTTDNILQVACDHLVAVDARMKPLIDAHYCSIFSPEGLTANVDPFESLASSIISQQVSGAAARSIKARFIALFDGEETEEKKEQEEGREKDDEDATEGGKRFPQPSQVAVMPLEQLRTAGLSQRKAEYVQGLAAKFASGELTAQLLAEAPYETLVERLVAVRGLGLWSVEMFAIFGLKRMDVFSVGDLGVQRGMAAFVGRDVAKLKTGGKGKWKYMAEKEMQAMAEPFRPYRSVFMWYMWRAESTDVSTLE